MPWRVFCFTVSATAPTRALAVVLRFGLVSVFRAVRFGLEDLRAALVRVADFRVAAFRFEPRFADFLLVAIVSSGRMLAGIVPVGRDHSGGSRLRRKSLDGL